MSKRGQDELLKLYKKLDEQNHGQEALFQSKLIENPTEVIVTLRIAKRKLEKSIRLQEDTNRALTIKIQKVKE